MNEQERYLKYPIRKKKEKKERKEDVTENRSHIYHDFLSKRKVYFNFQTDDSVIQNHQWARLRKQNRIDRTTVILINDSGRTLYRFLMIHSNTRIANRRYRAAFMDRFDKDDEKIRIQQWPFLLPQDQNQKQLKDCLTVQFCIADDKNHGSFVSINTQKKLAFNMRSNVVYQIIIGDKGWAIYSRDQKKELSFSPLRQQNQSYYSYLKQKDEKFNIDSAHYLKQRLHNKYSSVNQFNCFAQYQIEQFRQNSNLQLYRDSFSPIDQKYFEPTTYLHQYRYQPTPLQKIKTRVMNDIQFYSKRHRSKSQQTQKSNWEQQIKKQPILIEQHGLGNCYFLAVILQIICKAPFILEKLWIFHSFMSNYACVVLNIDGSMEAIEVDLDILAKRKDFTSYYSGFTRIDGTSDYCSFEIVYKAIIIEKAVAKVYSKYKNLELGSPIETFMMLANSCTKKYYAQQHGQYLDSMIKWTKQFKRDKQQTIKFGQELSNSKKQKPFSHISIQKNLEDIHMIVASFGDNQKQIKKLFKDKKSMSQEQLKEFQIQLKAFAQNFTRHSYSFQGIYNQPQKGQPTQLKSIFIKLRDPRGQFYARLWRKRWEKKYQFHVSKHENKTTKERIYIYKFSKVPIDYSRGEFILTLEDLISLNPLIFVCQYYIRNSDKMNDFHIYQSFSYKSYPVYFFDNNSQHFKLNLKQDSRVQIALHQTNKRRQYDAKDSGKHKKDDIQNDQIGLNWRYHQAGFSLQVKKDYRLYYFQDFSRFWNKMQQKQQIELGNEHPCKITPINFFNYWLPHGDYTLRVGLRHFDSKFCFLSILTISKDSILSWDPQKDPRQRQTAFSDWPQKNQNIELDFKQNTFLHKFTIGNEGQYVLRIDFSLNWGQEDLKQEIEFEKLIKVVFHCAQPQSYYEVLDNQVYKKTIQYKKEQSQVDEQERSKELPGRAYYYGVMKNNIKIKKKKDHLAFIELDKNELTSKFKDYTDVKLTYSIGCFWEEPDFTQEFN